jgi:hypothetical protein
MPNISDMNIVLRQGSAIKQMRVEVEQDVEANRQLIAQTAAIDQKKDQSRVKNMAAGDKSRMRPDDKKKHQHSAKSHDKALAEAHKPSNASGGSIVDVRV